MSCVMDFMSGCFKAQTVDLPNKPKRILGIGEVKAHDP